MIKTLVTLFTLYGVVLAQDYIDGQYFIHVDESQVQSASQDEAFSSILKTQYNINVKRSYNFKPKKILYVHADAQDIERVRQLKEVRKIEQDAWAYTDQTCQPVAHPGNWGLDRIDQRTKLSYTDPIDPSAEYLWGPNDGTGVSVYVLDTGIDVNHTSFEGRAYYDYIVSGISDRRPIDTNGHGTHCAGIVASRDYGVAKGATVHAVKMLSDNSTGAWSFLIEAIDWLTNLLDRPHPAVASMSVGGGGQIEAVQVAAEALIASGVPMIVSAGNSDLSACTQTPAYIPDCITVGSSTIDDAKASFSNHGNCTDVFAPGVDILSTYPNEDTAILSGSSMSCPHVAGSVARYLQYAPQSTPADVVTYIKGVATQDALSGLPDGTPNLLLFSDCTTN